MNELCAVGIRGENTDLTLRCDALARDREDSLVVLSATGPETSAKALAAVLQSDAKVRIYADLPDCSYSVRLKRHEAGYRVLRTRLAGNTCHIVCIAKAEGLLPALSPQAVWRELRGERFTTPLLRSWLSWLMQEMSERDGLLELRAFGCKAGLLLWDTNKLDELVSEGLQQGQLTLEAE